MSRPTTRTMLLLGIALAVTLGAGIAAGAGSVGVTDRTVAVDDRTNVTVSLDEAPDGLQRYNVTVALDSPDVARIEAARQGDVEGFQVRSQSADAVTFRAADLSQTVGTGATNVTLGTVTVTGTSPGETSLSITPHDVQTDDEQQADPSLSTGTLTVQAAGGEDGSDGQQGTGDAAGSDESSGIAQQLDATLPGPLVAWAAGGAGAVLTATVAIVIRRW